MAVYNMADPKDFARVEERLNEAKSKGLYIDLVVKKEQTQSQRNYLHLCISYLADYCGYTPEWVKINIVKAVVCPDIFLIQKRDRWGRDYSDYRSTSALNEDEMSKVISRFKDWCIENLEGFEFPDPEDYKVCMWITKMLQRKNKYQ